MNKITGLVDSVYLGASEETLSKQSRDSLNAQLDGLVGDRHGSIEREAWGAGDKQVEGVIRRNERQWSAVSVEELAAIAKAMDLTEPLSAASLGANLCLSGVPELSRLPKGSILKFPSGAELMVEEYNPPCLDMGKKLASIHSTQSGKAIHDTAFSQAAQYTRGLVGVVEVPGMINAGDRVEVTVYQPPLWLREGG
ncbi:MOSC domain-containing protein [Porticoccaceae bacterium]|nr:MOSC domain-containing protein [Porticoccaceae bacterium]